MIRKLALLFLLFLSLVNNVNAQQYAASKQITTAVPATSTKVNLYLTGAGFHKLVWTKSGTVTACSVRIDSSADGSSWTAGGVIAAQTCTSNGSTTVSTGVFNYARINVVTKTGSGTVTPVYFAYVNDPTGGGGSTLTVTTYTAGPVADPGGASTVQLNNSVGNITFNAHAWVSGYQRCYGNSDGKMGAITIQMAASNTVSVNGAPGSSGGTLVSGAALGDFACIFATDITNTWIALNLTPGWTNN